MYNIHIISNRPGLANESKKSLLPYESEIFNGDNYESFSKLINHCILKSKEEIVIICNDKSRPTSSDIDKMIKLINDGFGLVCLYRFGFFGFKKDLIRKIGFFDEIYIGGGYEDVDFVRRLKESNIGYYESEEIDYIYMTTSWNYQNKNSLSKKHYEKKWFENVPLYIERLMIEEKYQYDIGINNNTVFKNFNQSVLLEKNGYFWKDIEIKNNLS